MNLQAKLILGVLLVIITTIFLSTVGIGYLVGNQNDENSKNLVRSGIRHVQHALNELKQRSTKRITDFAADPSSIINMKYMLEIKGRKNVGAYKFILERPKEEMAKTVAAMAQEEGYSSFYVYDGKGGLILYLQKEDGFFETGFITYNDAGEEIVKYQQTETGYNQDMPWSEKPSVVGPASLYPLPLPQKTAIWFDRFNNEAALVGVAPFVSRMSEQRADVDFFMEKAGNIVGCIYFRKILDQGQAEKMQGDTGMDVNIFVGRNVRHGTLPDFKDLSMDFDTSPTTEQSPKEYPILINSLAGREYYQSIVPLNKDTDFIGAVALSLSREDTLRKTKENIVMLAMIMIVCMFVSVPITVCMAGKLSDRIDAILVAVREVTGGNLTARAFISSKDELGTLATAFNQMTDDLQHHMEKLQESEQKYRDLFDFAPDGILITTFEGEILSFNDTVRKMFRYEDHETFSRLRASDFYQYPQTERPKLMTELRLEGWLENYEVAFKDRLGKVFTAGLSMRLIQFEGRTSIQTIMRDLSRIKEMEAELRAYSADLEEMVEEKTAKLKGANNRLLMAYRDAEKMIEELGKTKSALEKSNFELEAVNKNLEETREQLALSAHQAGMAELAVSILHNIGNAINSVNVRAYSLEQEVKLPEIESLEKVYDFLQSEDIMGPTEAPERERREKLLRYLRTVIDSLRESSRQFAEDVEFIRKGIDHIMEIIALQQKYAGVRGFETLVNINDLLRDSVEMLKDSLKKRAISLGFNFSPVPDIVVNRNKMMQVLINIIKNSYESIDLAAPENGKRITLRTCLEKQDGIEYVKIEVEDTGAGLSPDIRDKVFRFNFSTKGRGTGFGLHDAANYVHAHEGSIDLTGKGSGKGAQLILRLPVPKGEPT